MALCYIEAKSFVNYYCKLFLDQVSKGIIERIDVSPNDFNQCIWVLHRPAIKKDPVSTTKIRPVLNCSLRTGGRPFLNDCVYPGVNLLTDMWNLLLKFRCNRFVLLADILKEIAKLNKGVIHVKFHYVNTNDNRTDLLIRGVSFDKFKAQFLFWLHGPSRLVGWLIG